jgi:hypothetical protein
MKIPKNIEKGVNRIALIAGVVALLVGFMLGANHYYKAHRYYALAPVGSRGGWVEPSPTSVTGAGLSIGAIVSVLTFLGVHGVVRLAVWVYEGFKKEE